MKTRHTDDPGYSVASAASLLVITSTLCGGLVGCAAPVAPRSSSPSGTRDARGERLADDASLPGLAGPPAGARAVEAGWSWSTAITFWRPSVAGEMLITKGGIDGSGTDIDLEQDLSLEPDRATDIELQVRRGGHRLSFVYQPLSFRGHSVLESPFVYHDQTYTAGTNTWSQLDLDYARLAYDYEIGRPAGVALRTGVEYSLWSMHTHIEGRTPEGTRLDESRGFSHGLPALRVAADWRHDWLGAGLLAVYGKLPHDRGLLDLELDVTTHWIDDRLSIGAGYKWMTVDINETTNDGDIFLRGPFAILSWRF